MEDFPSKMQARSGKKRRNKYAKELQSKKYRQRVVPKKKRPTKPPEYDWYDEED